MSAAKKGVILSINRVSGGKAAFCYGILKKSPVVAIGFHFSASLPHITGFR
jgi:hypothetical protein